MSSDMTEKLKKELFSGNNKVKGKQTVVCEALG